MVTDENLIMGYLISAAVLGLSIVLTRLFLGKTFSKRTHFRKGVLRLQIGILILGLLGSSVFLTLALSLYFEVLAFESPVLGFAIFVFISFVYSLFAFCWFGWRVKMLDDRFEYRNMLFLTKKTKYSDSGIRTGKKHPPYIAHVNGGKIIKFDPLLTDMKPLFDRVEKTEKDRKQKD
jgi:hypothetical protein